MKNSTRLFLDLGTFLLGLSALIASLTYSYKTLYTPPKKPEPVADSRYMIDRILDMTQERMKNPDFFENQNEFIRSMMGNTFNNTKK